MASAAIYIQKKPYKDGTVPVFIRLTIDRQIYLKQICKSRIANVDFKKKEIRKGEPGYIKLNLLISRTLQEAKEYLIDCKLRKANPDAAAFFGSADRSGTISAHITNLADQMKRAPDSFFTGRKYAAVANKIKALDVDINIRSLDKEWIKKFDIALQGLGNKPATRRKDMVVISATINAAGIANPFAGYKKPSGSGTKSSLTRKEFERMAMVDLPPDLHIYRQAFIFAVMARGMRRHDLFSLQWTMIKGDRLIFTPDKTRKAEKEVNMAINDKMREILIEMEGNKPYVFPIIKADPAMAVKNPVGYKNIINKNASDMNAGLKEICLLAKIDKRITIHSARHTFSYLADKGRVALGDIQRTLNHSSPEVTAGYLAGLRETDELDEATEGLF